MERSSSKGTQNAFFIREAGQNHFVRRFFVSKDEPALTWNDNSIGVRLDEHVCIYGAVFEYGGDDVGSN